MNEARRVQGMLGVLFVAIAALAIAVGVWLRLTPAPPPTAACTAPRGAYLHPESERSRRANLREQARRHSEP
jgi:hypothetical protein